MVGIGYNTLGLQQVFFCRDAITPMEVIPSISQEANSTQAFRRAVSIVYDNVISRVGFQGN